MSAQTYIPPSACIRRHLPRKRVRTVFPCFAGRSPREKWAKPNALGLGRWGEIS